MSTPRSRMTPGLPGLNRPETGPGEDDTFVSAGWLRLRFAEPALEAAYGRAYARQSIGHLRTIGVLVAIVSVLIGLAVADYSAGITPTQMRAVSTGIGLLFACLAAVAHQEWFLRFSQPLTLMTTLVPLAFFAWIGLSTSAAEIQTFGAGAGILMFPDDARILILGPFLLTVTFATSTAARLRFRSAAVHVSLTTLIFVVIVIRHPPSTGVVMPFGTIYLAAMVLSLVAAYQLEVYSRRDFAKTAQLDRAFQQSEDLLLNVLPAPIADRLKQQSGSIADGFEQVTVLFADVAGFTTMSDQLAPADVVTFLNEVFTRFDGLAESLNLEKIKTIGDAYMVAGGIPNHREDHAEAVAEMALAMRETAAELVDPLGQPLSLRIGINTGPVVAGVIGVKKFNYDLWGDTVNTASRMESHGTPGRIQITDATREQLGDRFLVEDRGDVDVKGKGRMRVWYLEGCQPGS